MKQKEQRKFIRYDALHILDYVVIDENGDPGDYSMGRTVDVSIDGIKLETSSFLKTGTRLMITVGLEDDLVDLEGRTTHASPHNGRFVSGIGFLRISKEGRRVFTKYVEAFRRRKAELESGESPAATPSDDSQ